MLLRNSKNTPIINLDKVTQIYPGVYAKQEVFKLYFMFDALNADDVNEAVWIFDSEDELNKVLSKLEITTI